MTKMESTSRRESVNGIDYAHKENFKWISVIRLPDFVTNKKKKSVEIPSSVRIGGSIYKIIRIEDGAFKGMKKLKSVKFGIHVEEIGKNAFKGCNKLPGTAIFKTKKKLSAKYQKSFTEDGNLSKKALFVTDPVKIKYKGKKY